MPRSVGTCSRQSRRLWIWSSSSRSVRSLRIESAICSAPATRPCVQTLVASQIFGRILSSANRSPSTSSERPYIGEVSITAPPAWVKSRSTSRSGSRSAASPPTSNVFDEPMPMTGTVSSVRGMRRVTMRELSADHAACGRCPATAPAATRPMTSLRVYLSRSIVDSIESGRPAPEEARADQAQHHLVLLIYYLRPLANAAHERAAPRRRRIDHRQAAAQPVARVDGLEPSQLIDAGRTQARLGRQIVVDPHPHHHGGGIPAACAQPAEDRRLAGLAVDVKGLWVVALGEADDFLLRHFHAAELEHRAGREVLEVIDPCRHASTSRAAGWRTLQRKHGRFLDDGDGDR